MTQKDKRPNFLIIVADDLGFTDLGSFGSEIKTPNLDRLSLGWNKNGTGARFTDFHTAPACSPTRSMLFSGTDNHIAGVGQMAEFIRGNPLVFEKLNGKPGYEGYLNDRVAPLPEILKDNGYYTWITGKWHLGLLKDQWPIQRGFEKSYTLLPGAGSHFKYFPNLNEKNTFLPALFCEDDREVDPEKEIPEDFYSTNFYTDKGISYISDDEVRGDRPFFGCLTYTAPHWPFQAPASRVEKYRGKYNKGPEELRNSRLAEAFRKEIIPEGVDPHKMTTHKTKRWQELNDDERKYEERIMETYAAMVEILDENIGRVIRLLEERDELEHTFILFMSDNGADGMIHEALPLGATNVIQSIKNNYNNSYENIGKKDSFVYYNDQWAQAATAPWFKFKAWASEGGIRCPLIVHYPPLLQPLTDGNNRIHNTFITVMDILPTVLELAHVKHPGELYKSRRVVKPKGASWVSYLRGDSQEVHDENTVTGWELFGQQAIRKGNYKALFVPKPFGAGKWELFNIRTDPGETKNVAAEYGEVLEDLLHHWTNYVAETGMIEIGPEYDTLLGNGTPIPKLEYRDCF
ncbi:uncharacterized protein PRCAT00004348001 [Priceomyces carsonii]|uniref:uncharacterized protein n=1 Tax=Priceomyces carsonii TaxID=28549 RepID=UPI002EDA8124|nr:unnamed protein product [Priceomyces carsonii]